MLGSDPAAKGYLGALLALLSAIYFREMVPFREDFTNVIAVVAQYSIMTVYLAALMIQSGSLEKFGLSDFLLGCILSGATIIVIVMALYVAYHRHQRSIAEKEAAEARKLKIEWAAHFSKNKFHTTFQFAKSDRAETCGPLRRLKSRSHDRPGPTIGLIRDVGARGAVLKRTLSRCRDLLDDE